MGAILAGLLVFALVLGPLVARVVFDRRLQRASAVAADVRAAVRQRLGGESFVSVQVWPTGLWGRGRVLLSAPSGYEDLIQKVWPVVIKCIPAGHDLVVRPAPPRPARLTPEAARFSRVA